MGALGALEFGLGMATAHKGSERERLAAENDDAAGMTLGNELENEGMGAATSGALHVGEGATRNLASIVKKQAMRRAGKDAGKEALEQIGSSAGSGLSTLADTFGVVGQAGKGAQGLYEMGKAGVRGKRLKDVKAGAGGGAGAQERGVGGAQPPGAVEGPQQQCWGPSPYPGGLDARAAAPRAPRPAGGRPRTALPADRTPSRRPDPVQRVESEGTGRAG